MCSAFYIYANIVQPDFSHFCPTRIFSVDLARLAGLAPTRWRLNSQATGVAGITLRSIPAYGSACRRCEIDFSSLGNHPNKPIQRHDFDIFRHLPVLSPRDHHIGAFRGNVLEGAEISFRERRRK